MRINCLETSSFSEELNNLYSKFCWSIKRNKNFIRHDLDELLRLIANNWDKVPSLPKEDLYIVINALKIAKSENYIWCKGLYDSDVFHELDESYANSR